MATKTEWPLHSVERALLALSSHDTDYAREQNGIGFNGLDTAFGNSLAEKIVTWGHLTFRQAAAAYKMLRKYRGQLMRDFGIDYDQIPQPTEGEPVAKVKGTVWLHDDTLVIDSPYDAKLLNALRVLPTRRWEQNGNPASRLRQKGVWLVPLTIDNLETIRKVIVDFGLDCEPEAKTALDNAEKALVAVVDASAAKDANVDVPDNLGVTLLPFQRASLAYARQVLGYTPGGKEG